MGRMDRMAHVIASPRARSITRVRPFIDASPLLGDPAALASLASTNGYLFVRGLAPRDTIRELRAEVLAYCARREWLDESAPRSRGAARADAAARATRDEFLAMQAAIQVLPVFSALGRSSAILSVLEAILQAPPVGGYGNVVRLSFPGDLERTTAPHQDFFYTRGSTSLWTVWIPLGDCPASLGGIAVLPGTHASGLRPHDGGDGEARFIVLDDDDEWVGASYRTGDVLMFNALTVHGARPNVTPGRIRISADFRFQPL